MMVADRKEDNRRHIAGYKRQYILEYLYPRVTYHYDLQERRLDITNMIEEHMWLDLKHLPFPRQWRAGASRKGREFLRGRQRDITFTNPSQFIEMFEGIQPDAMYLPAECRMLRYKANEVTSLPLPRFQIVGGVVAGLHLIS